MNEDTRPSVSEVAESLTGYEEIGIEKAFGGEPSDLPGSKSLRALAFVLFKRQGQNHADALDSALSLGIKACADLFADEDDKEVMPDEPVTASGKGDSSPVSEQMSSLPSS